MVRSRHVLDTGDTVLLTAFADGQISLNCVAPALMWRLQ
jgi:hypothetical protein